MMNMSYEQCYSTGDKLQVVSVTGIQNEEVPLYTRLDATKTASIWLRNLESILKNTMAIMLQACVQTRMEEGLYM